MQKGRTHTTKLKYSRKCRATCWAHSLRKQTKPKKIKTIMEKKKITTQKNNGIYANSTLTVVKANVFYQMDLFSFSFTFTFARSLVHVVTKSRTHTHTHTKLNGKLFSTTFPSLFRHPIYPNSNSHNSQMCAEDEKAEVCCCCFVSFRTYSRTRSVLCCIVLCSLNYFSI